MRSIKRRFDLFVEKYPDFSSFIQFGYAVDGQNFSDDRLRRELRASVNPEDFKGVDYRTVLKHFRNLTQK